jgi:hypothetical protein
MAPSPSSSLTFPHPELTPISGEPTITSLRLFQKELYANARQIYSTRGGGVNGHLSILLSDIAYLTRTNNVPFLIPVHPGTAPRHARAALGPQIDENVRLFNQTIDDHRLYERVKAELKQQILKAVNSIYLQVLEDIDYGFAEVSPRKMLTHLVNTYGQVTPEDLERNRNLLTAEWNPDDPIETIWIRMRDCQAFAKNIEDIPDTTAIRLTLTVFDKTGVMNHCTERWREKPVAELTRSNFIQHFNAGNKERIRKLTAHTAGYHSANHTETPVAPPTSAAAATAPPAIVVDDVRFYYCHTHGLTKSSAHTSATCSNPGANHEPTATIKNMKDGNNSICGTSYRRPGRPNP